jgi:hypothetical protein
MPRRFSIFLLLLALSVLTVTIVGTAFATPNKGADCSQCHNSQPTQPAAPNTTTPKATLSCKKTSTDVLQSCKFGADNDYWLAIAKCDNLFTFNDLKVCKKQALEGKISGKEDCVAQYAVRKEICKDLGQASYNPVINPADFSTTIDNQYFPLKHGTTFIYEGKKDGKIEHVEAKVTDKTKVILGVTCVEVRDRGKIDGVLAEDTLDWYAQDKDGNVWYFGENSVEYDARGEIVSLEGSWKAGVDGAMPGIIMKAAPQVGDLYRQEFALGVAEDMAEVLSLNESLLVNSVTYNNCLKTKEFSPLEPDVLENKFYAPGVGNIRTVDTVSGEFLDLVQID